MTERESDAQVHDPKQPPLLQALDVSAFGGSPEPLDLVCDIDDPDCEVPGADAAETPGAETPAVEVERTDVPPAQREQPA